MDLVARQEALAALREATARADAGRGRLVVVSGEPGIGKSAIVAKLAEEAEARGASIARGRAWELAEAPPYFPLRPCLATIGVTPEGDAFSLFERVLPALAARARDKLVVWTVDDVHAADLATLDLLTLLAQPIAALRVLIVAAARMQDTRITDRVAQRLARMSRDGHEVRLAPLGPEDVGALASQVLGRALPPAAVTELVSLTGGNPLFVVECARAFQAAGAAPRAVPSLPHTVRNVVIERVDALPESARRTLEAAAILGREVAAGTVARMLDSLPAQVIDALAPAVRGGMLVETRPAQFLFTHILVRDAVEDAIPPARRVELHGRAADALGGDSVDVLVERARHALDAMRADGLELGARAAKALEEQRAWDRAWRMHQRLEDARRAGLGAPLSSDARLHHAHIARAAGFHAEGRRICEEVLSAARAAGDPALLGRAALELGAVLRPGAVDRVLVGALEEARAGLGDREPALACRVIARLAAAKQPAPDPNVPLAIAFEALEKARALGDDAVILDVLAIGGSAYVDYGPVESRVRWQSELLERAELAGDTTKIRFGLLRLGMEHAEGGDFAGWESAVERVLDLSVVDRRDHWRALLFASMHAVAHGDLAASDRFLVDLHQIASVTDDPALSLSLSAHIGQNTRMLHRDEEMLASFPTMVAAMRDVPHGESIAALLRASSYVRMEDAAAVRAELATIGLAVSAIEGDTFSTFLAEVYAFVGDRAGCARMLAFWGPLADRHATTGHVAMSYEGPVRRLLGILHAALGDLAAAETDLAAALATMTEHGVRTWIAQLRYDLAKVVAARGRASEAAALRAGAAALAEEIGMPGLVRRARAQTTSAPPPAPKTTSSFVLARDGDAWRVEHAGKTTRVKDNRGMQLLARLVERPGEELHVLALASDDTSASLHDTGAGDVIDARARKAYKARLDELDERITDAEADADVGRLASLRHEKELLERELSRAFGLGGHARAAGSASERARVNVQRRIKDAIERIREVDPAAGEFLSKAVRTGTHCRFLF